MSDIVALRACRLVFDGWPITHLVRVFTPADVTAFLWREFEIETQERFVVLHLDQRRQVIGWHVAALGSVNETTVHPREVFRTAIQNGAAHVILSHNHPTGDPSPSDQDHAITYRLRAAGELIGIGVLDHVITAGRDFYSFEQEGR